jgi:hypothetical protein
MTKLESAIASDDQQARKVRLLRFGTGAVSAHRIERPFAAGLDESEQRADMGRANLLAARFHGCGRL